MPEVDEKRTGNAEAWYSLGIAYGKLNRYNDAIEAYRQALRINPEYADAWYNLGVAYGNLNRYNDAIEAYRQALRINPEYADAWYNLGVAYGELKRYNDAIEAYRQALRINPEYADAWNNLGSLTATQPLQRRHRSLPPGPAHQSGACRCLVQPRGRLRQTQPPR